MNLVVNARDAMPTGGRLTIETSTVELDDSGADNGLGLKAGSYVVLSVSDSGSGMDKATQSRVFEPFFTTKEHGQGTGLGLSTVYGIAKQSGGSVWLRSELGRGTTFKVYLPRAAAQGAQEVLPALRTVRAAGTETVLLVEDDATVREVARRILARAGYDVLAARGPEEALRIVNQRRDIALLVSDIVMPNMNGRELAERVTQQQPGIRVLFMSGHTADVTLRLGVLGTGVPLVQKPLTPDGFTDKVREVLDAAWPTDALSAVG
jgi:CheY-like chemotaxis protein